LVYDMNFQGFLYRLDNNNIHLSNSNKYIFYNLLTKKKVIALLFIFKNSFSSFLV